MAGRTEGAVATRPLNSRNEEPRRDNDAIDDVTAAAAIAVASTIHYEKLNAIDSRAKPSSSAKPTMQIL